MGRHGFALESYHGVLARMVDERTRLQWIKTAGGPHLVLPEAYAAEWEGFAIPSGGRVVKASFQCNPGSPATDYDRACSVKGWLGVIPVGKGMALVLHGDDTIAAYYRTARGQHYLLRWLFAPSETALLDYFHDVQKQLLVEHEAGFRHPGGKLLLMDSVDLPGSFMTPPSEFVLPRGRYRVLTSHSQSEEVYIIVHQLRRE
jgi:hypothetical protein